MAVWGLAHWEGRGPLPRPLSAARMIAHQLGVSFAEAEFGWVVAEGDGGVDARAARAARAATPGIGSALPSRCQWNVGKKVDKYTNTMTTEAFRRTGTQKQAQWTYVKII
eukprot:1195901-Prorocentrum_minimum.AAC.4